MTPNPLNAVQIIDLRKSGEILSKALEETVGYVKEGISALSLDEIAEKALRKRGAIPSFKNYHVSGSGRFPATLCVSINDELVHGLPRDDKIIRNGDLVSLDLGANYHGMFSDMATTVGVGRISKSDANLIDTARSVLDYAIGKIRPETKTGDLGYLIEKFINDRGFVAIHDLVGHGIGIAPHTEPQIPNFGQRGAGVVLSSDTAIAIEPMVSISSNQIKTDRDGWTIKMQNGQKCAHFEKTILLMNGKAEAIT